MWWMRLRVVTVSISALVMIVVRAGLVMTWSLVGRVPKSTFCPHDRLPNLPGTFGMLLLDGLILRAVEVEGRPSLEVLGTGDVIRPFEAEPDPDATVAHVVQWWALQPAKLAVLDASFIRRMADYPEVIGDLAGRLSRGSAAGCLRLSIVQQPRLSTRLEIMLWHLADRFGRVHSEGVLLPVPMCHGLLSWARRREPPGGLPSGQRAPAGGARRTRSRRHVVAAAAT